MHDGRTARDSELSGGAPTTRREVKAFLAVELELNDEWQASWTVRLWRNGQWLYRTRQASALHAFAWKMWVLAERVWFHSLLNADLPAGLEIGAGVRFAHGGRNVVLHHDVRFGRRCTIYHSVTVGVRGSTWDVPAFGDDVILGAGCVVMGGVTVGNGAAVGPNAVVVSDVAEQTHVVASNAVELERRLDLPELRTTATGRKVPRV